MPQMTALRRVSTVVVGMLFAVVFVCSAASASQGVAKDSKSAASLHTSTSKASARTFDAVLPKDQAPAPVQLATTGPVPADDSPVFDIESVDEQPVATTSATDITTSDRAPPAL